MYAIEFFLCAISLLSQRSYAQFSYIPIINYPDKTTIERVIKREHARSLPTLVYQPALENKLRATSVLLLRKGNLTTYWLIRRDTIVTSGVLAGGTRLFAYSALAKTGATTQERGLKFVPPVMYGLREQIIYADASRQFFFEIGIPVSYIPDMGRERYRSEWAKQIRRVVEHLL